MVRGRTADEELVAVARAAARLIELAVGLAMAAKAEAEAGRRGRGVEGADAVIGLWSGGARGG